MQGLDQAIVAVIAFILGGAFNAAVGLVTGDIRDGRTHSRELSRLRAGRAMEERLKDLGATDWEVTRVLARALEMLSGWRGLHDIMLKSYPQPSGGVVDIGLLGDASLYERYRRLVDDFKERQESGLTEEDYKRWRELSTDLTIALVEQREAVLRGETPQRIPSDDQRRLLMTAAPISKMLFELPTRGGPYPGLGPPDDDAPTPLAATEAEDLMRRVLAEYPIHGRRPPPTG